LTLRQKQSLFVSMIGQLILWSYQQGFEFTFSDGSIDPFRKVRLKDGTTVAGARDLVHMEDGLHYRRLAMDLNLFIDGVWIQDGDHPAWKSIGTKWEGMHPLAAWGGRFKSRDSNHFSLRDGGKE
jgi:hypothetical protein